MRARWNPSLASTARLLGGLPSTVASVFGLALALVVVPALVPGSAAAAPVAAHTEISGSMSGYAELDLREPVTPFPRAGERADFYLGGDGWLRAAELRAVNPGPDGYRPSVFLLRLEHHDVTGDGALLMAGTRYPNETLPPGHYRFYLWIEPGRSAEAYFRFPGLTGETRLSPDVAVPLDQQALRTFDGGAPLTTAFGRTGELTSSGWVLLRLRTLSDSPSVDWIETCTYYGGDEVAGQDAYQRGCPGGLGGGSESVPRKGEDMIIFGLFDKPLRVGIGGNLTAGGLPPRFQVWSAYFSYGDPAPGGDTSAGAPPAPTVISPTSGAFPGATGAPPAGSLMSSALL